MIEPVLSEIASTLAGIVGTVTAVPAIPASDGPRRARIAQIVYGALAATVSAVWLVPPI